MARRRYLVALTIGLALVATFVGSRAIDGDPENPEAVAAREANDSLRRSEGKALPDLAFTRFDGGDSSLGAYGGKPLVINFFSSTCVPCITEMPAFEKVKQAVDSDVTFLGINVRDAVKNGQELVDETGITWDIGRDPRGEILTRLGGLGMPTTVLVNEHGRIVFTHSGALDSGELREQIDEKLLA